MTENYEHSINYRPSTDWPVDIPPVPLIRLADGYHTVDFDLSMHELQDRLRVLEREQLAIWRADLETMAQVVIEQKVGGLVVFRWNDDAGLHQTVRFAADQPYGEISHMPWGVKPE